MKELDSNSYQYSNITDEGSVRELNEDSLFCSDNLWIVADGMGGHACGEVASKLAVEKIVERFNKNGQLLDAIQIAHHKILEVSHNNPAQSGMGCTIVALTTSGENYEIAWVGDSRAYLWNQSQRELKQLSEDHSLVTRLINANLITAEEALTHPKRHMITQCLGSVDLTNVQVDTIHGTWNSGQQILLCSDGLTDELSDKEIADILQKNITADEKTQQLLDNANLAGGKDNISIILVDSPVLEVSGIWNKIKLLFT